MQQVLATNEFRPDGQIMEPGPRPGIMGKVGSRKTRHDPCLIPGELILSSPVAPWNRNSTKELESKRSQRPATDPGQGTSAHASWKTRCNTCLTTTRYDLKTSGSSVRSGEWRSLVARLLWEQDAAGSNPVSPISNSGQWLDSRPPKPYLALPTLGFPVNV